MTIIIHTLLYNNNNIYYNNFADFLFRSLVYNSNIPFPPEGLTNNITYFITHG